MIKHYVYYSYDDMGKVTGSTTIYSYIDESGIRRIKELSGSFTINDCKNIFK